MSKSNITLVILISLLSLQYTYAVQTKSSSSSKDSTASETHQQSQNEAAEQNVKWYQMVTNVPSDYATFFKDAVNEKMIPSYIGIAALTGSLMFVDQRGWAAQHRLFLKSPLDHRTSNFVVNFGNGAYQFAGAAAFAAAGLVFNDQTAIRTGSNIAEAVLATGVFVQLLKRITGRQSPAASSESGGDWLFMPSIKEYQKNQPRYYSFPSGHLSTATAILTVIANNYPDQKWIRPVGYPLLGLLGFSLVNKGMHWYSDLPLAYFLGYTFGNIVAPVKTNKNTWIDNEEQSSLRIFPSVGPNNLEFNLLFSF